VPRVLVLNNYPLDNLWREAENGQTPDHLMFGVNYLPDHGFEVKLAPMNAHRWLSWLSVQLPKWRWPFPLGDLDQQWAARKLLEDADLIYAPCQTQTPVLACLRSLGWLKRPIVALAHHPLERGRLTRIRKPFWRRVVNGTDYFPALCATVAREINALANSPGKSEVLPWGPDARYYPPAEYPGEGVVCAGRTARDLITFGLAASAAGCLTRIICLKSQIVPDFCGFGRKVEVLPQPQSNWMGYPELCGFYAKARALAIPLHPSTSLAGYTSLMDALGMGKPVIMTRLPIFDFDVEALGIGKWVAPGDQAGWRAALEWFDHNPETAISMGQKARRLVEEGLNSHSFADRVARLLKQALQRH